MILSVCKLQESKAKETESQESRRRSYPSAGRQEKPVFRYEFASGIPGTLGGGVHMNDCEPTAEMKDIVHRHCTYREGEIRTGKRRARLRLPCQRHQRQRATSYLEQNLCLFREIKKNSCPYAGIENKRVGKQRSRFRAPAAHLLAEGYFANLVMDAGLRLCSRR